MSRNLAATTRGLISWFFVKILFSGLFYFIVVDVVCEVDAVVDGIVVEDVVVAVAVVVVDFVDLIVVVVVVDVEDVVFVEDVVDLIVVFVVLLLLLFLLMLSRAQKFFSAWESETTKDLSGKQRLPPPAFLLGRHNIIFKQKSSKGGSFSIPIFGPFFLSFLKSLEEKKLDHKNRGCSL